MRDCPFHAFQDCDCGDQCKSKAVSLGRFEKPIPMPYPKTHYLSGAVVCVAVWGLFVAMNGGLS
jgi:hypothetical protein